MNDTTLQRARTRRRRALLAATAAISIAVATGLGLAACGAGDQQVAPAGTPSTSAPATADPRATGGATVEPGDGGIPGNAGSASGSGASGGGDGDGQPEEPSDRPPRIVFPDVQAYLYEGELVAEVFGHAFDDDGPDPQLRVERVEIEWGDGTATTAQLEGHGAFRDYHEYASSYEGRRVTIRIVAYGHDGQTATETASVNLPTQP
jgi:hypothetical protein